MTMYSTAQSIKKHAAVIKNNVWCVHWWTARNRIKQVSSKLNEAEWSCKCKKCHLSWVRLHELCDQDDKYCDYSVGVSIQICAALNRWSIYEIV